jgi:MarR family transcriptional regulator, organic hydroperoxide resistance regulator
VESGGQVLFAFVRFWSRRWTGAGSGVDPERGRDVMVVEAVHALRTRTPVSVNDIAHELGVDQSGASRMVARAERLNLLTRRAPDSVGRRSSINVTASGEDLLRQAHAWQDAIFQSLTADWSVEDVQSLLTLMGRLLEAQTKRDTR